MKKERFCPILALLLIGLCGCWSPAQSSLSPNVPEVLAALESEGWDIAFVEPSSDASKPNPEICPSTDWPPAPPEWCLHFDWKNRNLVFKPSWPTNWTPHPQTPPIRTLEIPHDGSRWDATQPLRRHGHPDSMRPILERSV